ncbi:hypothetical protein Y88_1224 [Novosphingobium nitrogenifigens DSM 19370]|uniref:Lipopolysaccharide assembly protein A domain-containing protein n=1 Tax=Novosphingobium nitrogenifigens DSM 19370 TaxID=983920 RepID=F1Z863_9SPHN|nr:LapA family protein [Novosphingobium nitrogenifigens]EGD59162.1 hypothetical protein Y88_1224 [Novosphingobium nitrogenifigens DSM 19370]
MKVLITGFWLLAGAALIAFTVANWGPVDIRIWPGLIWETKLPALVIGALLIGFLPTWLVHRTTRWRLSRRITTLESTLAAQAQAATAAISSHSPTPPEDQAAS